MIAKPAAADGNLHGLFLAPEREGVWICGCGRVRSVEAKGGLLYGAVFVDPPVRAAASPLVVGGLHPPVVRWQFGEMVGE